MEQEDFFAVIFHERKPHSDNRSLNAATLEEWSSQTIARTLKLHSLKILRQSFICSRRKFESIFVSGTAFTTYDTVSFNPAIMKETTPLHNSLFSLAPIGIPAKYSSHLWRNIWSKIKTTSFDIFPVSFNFCIALTVSIPPSVIFFKNDKDGKRNTSAMSRYDCREV